MSKPVCPECKSENVLYRIKSNTFVCRRCGESWEKKELKKSA